MDHYINRGLKVTVFLRNYCRNLLVSLHGQYSRFVMKEVGLITLSELHQMAASIYGNMVKAVVDVKRGVLIVDSELHVDQEQLLLEQGSNQQDLWGINLYPQKFGSDGFIEFDSMINIRPRQQNMSRGVENEKIKKCIVDLVMSKVSE
jgi:hypothetical protein